MEQAVMLCNFKRRYMRSPYNSAYCSTKPLFSSTGDVLTRSRFVTLSFNFGSFSPTEIISHAQKNIIATDTDIKYCMWQKRAPLLGLTKSIYYVNGTVFQFHINHLAEIQLKLFWSEIHNSLKISGLYPDIWNIRSGESWCCLKNRSFTLILRAY